MVLPNIMASLTAPATEAVLHLGHIVMCQGVQTLALSMTCVVSGSPDPDTPNDRRSPATTWEPPPRLHP